MKLTPAGKGAYSTNPEAFTKPESVAQGAGRNAARGVATRPILCGSLKKKTSGTENEKLKLRVYRNEVSTINLK